MMDLEEYTAFTASTHEQRIAWWRQSALGLFIHYGVYSAIGRGEWVRMREGIPDDEYHRLAAELPYRRGSAAEWVELAKRMGAGYAVMTAVHHDGFALWDSAVNPFNSVKLTGVDVVREFTDACHRSGIRCGLYFSLWNWEHPDGMRCADDEEARRRFTAFVTEEVRELMSGYGKIDILWYDVPSPLKTAEEWDSLARNRMVRSLQPEIIINNRSMLPEDFETPEDKIVPAPGDWEACMRFTPIGFGGVDGDRSAPYRLTAQGIVKLLCRCRADDGNLIFNVSPDGSGAVSPGERRELERLGDWMKIHGDAVRRRPSRGGCGANGVCTATRSGNRVLLWNWIWPRQKDGETKVTLSTGGYYTRPRSVRLVTTGQEIPFTYAPGRLILQDLPLENPDTAAGVPLFELDFGDEKPVYRLTPPNTP